MSKLIVEVCKVEKIEKHPNADRLSIVTVKGWNCVVSLDQYKEGDLVVYCPPDSLIPEDIIEKYNLEFLKKNGRVGTIKLRKCISQGLILSIPEGKTWKKGKDVAKELGIVKYEVPEPKFQQFKGNRPTKKKKNPLFDKYTDINNIKNYNNVFKEGDLVVITEKIHGTNFRAGRLPRYTDSLWGKIKSLLFGKYEFIYGSHRVQITHHNNRHCFYGEDVYGKIAKKYKLAEIIPEDYTIYGEIYGKGIQDLEYGKEDTDIMFFDVKYKGNYLDFNDARKFIASLGLRYVPILSYGKYTLESVKEYTNGTSILDLKTIREGCVIKPVKEENDVRIGRKILKSVGEEYLLRKGATEYK